MKRLIPAQLAHGGQRVVMGCRASWDGTARHPIPWSGKDLIRRPLPTPRKPNFFRKKLGNPSIVSLGGFPKATVTRPPLHFDWVDS